MSKIHSSLLVIETGLFVLQIGQRITLSVCKPEKTNLFRSFYSVSGLLQTYKVHENLGTITQMSSAWSKHIGYICNVFLLNGSILHKDP